MVGVPSNPSDSEDIRTSGDRVATWMFYVGTCILNPEFVTDDRRGGGWLGKRDDFYYRVDITEMEYTWTYFLDPSCQMMRFRISLMLLLIKSIS